MPYPKANLTFVSYKELRALPPPEMLIEDLIPMEGIIALSADPNIGKTFLMMEMARSLVTATPFLGKFKTRRGAVLFVGQDASVLDYARQVRKVSGKQWQEREAWLELQRAELGDHPSLINPFDDLMQYVLQPGFYFEDKGHVNALIEAVNAYEHTHLEKKQITVVKKGAPQVKVIEEHKTGFDIIFFDTFASMKMLDENSNTDMQICMNNARTIANETGAAVVFSHHHDKAFERLRGASVLSASADVHIELRKKKEGRTDDGRYVDTLVTLKKFRGMKIDPFRYRLTTTKEAATMLYTGEAEQEEPSKKQEPSEGGLKYEDCAASWSRVLAASTPGSEVKVSALLAHVRTLGNVSSRTLYSWMKRFREVHEPSGYFKVSRQAISLTDAGRASKIFTLDNGPEKE